MLGKRLAKGAVIALTVVVLAGGTAWAADYRWWRGYVYEDTRLYALPECTYLYVRIGNTSWPSLDSHTSWDGSKIDGTCGEDIQFARRNSVLIRQDLYKWSGTAWYRCSEGPWVFNIGESSSALTGYNWYAPSPCGAGWYTATAGGFTAPYSDTWHGGWREVSEPVYVAA
jgi:hypothetical protein